MWTVAGTDPRTNERQKFTADDERMANRMRGNLAVRGLVDIESWDEEDIEES